jgi:hypothetical protein
VTWTLACETPNRKILLRYWSYKIRTTNIVLLSHLYILTLESLLFEGFIDELNYHFKTKVIKFFDASFPFERKIFHVLFFVSKL